MNWKIYITVFVSAFIISFPQNIIGCGPDADPYDYYTSFFSQHLASVSTFKPFYYTGYNFLYDEQEPVDTRDVLAAEWAAYCRGVNAEDAESFVMQYALKDINSLYYAIEKAQPLKIPDSVKRNSMTNYFLQQKDLEALGYIIYAKKVEPYVAGDLNSWEPVKRDTAKMAKLILNGQQLYKAAKAPLFKLKYAYQIIRLAHYSNQYAAAIKYYDQYIPTNDTKSVLKDLSLALKAGALYKAGDTRQAAYLFSKVFIETDVKRVSNYLGFNWAVVKANRQEDYLALCKNNSEKAAMLSMFAMGSTENELPALKKIYALQPSLNLLEVIVTREVNKLEEKYFTPTLTTQAGGREFYYTWSDGVNDSAMKAGKEQAKALASFLSDAGDNAEVSNPGLLKTAAAYCAFITRDYHLANRYLSAAKKLKLTPKVADQWALTNLLVTVNEQEKITPAFEEKILPSIKWLREKALAGTAVKIGYYETEEWKIFYRNLMSSILARRYHAQGDLHKEVLAIGSADNIFNIEVPGYSNALEFLRNKLVSSDVEKLYALVTNKSLSNFDQYLVKNNSLKLADVVDFAGTAFLRDYKLDSAIAWFNKGSQENKKYSINKNPFIELLYDQEEFLSNDKKSYSKLEFAKEMLRLQNVIKTDPEKAPAAFYKMALGMYNMTYYGYAWEMVQYERSGSDGYFIPKSATQFQKEYYGCFTAHEYFMKAMKSSTDKNFRAKCLFMMAKCSQKTIRQPQYGDFRSQDYSAYDAASKTYFETFKQNKYFPQFVAEYTKTPFYQTAFSSCSYLRDFVKAK